MSKHRFSHHECPVARGLDQIGNWWTLLVVREVMYGLHQFNDIRDSLGISRAILAERLKELTQNGILARHTDADDRRTAHYRLTAKGADLWPVIVAMLTWSNKHVLADGEDLVRAFNGETEQPIETLCARDAKGNITALSDMVLRTGKSASPHLSARIDKAFSKARVDAPKSDGSR